MHEYSIVRALLARVDQEVRAQKASTVHRLSVRIGELAGIEPDLLASAYQICRERTVCQEADLVIDRVPARWACSACQTPIAPGAVLRCSACGQPGRLLEGDEILLSSIEMEVP